jgi:hypothetical protein
MQRNGKDLRLSNVSAGTSWVDETAPPVGTRLRPGRLSWRGATMAQCSAPEQNQAVIPAEPKQIIDDQMMERVAGGALVE